MVRLRLHILIVAFVVMLPWGVGGQTIDPQVGVSSLFGLDVLGKLHRYDFASDTLATIGVMKLENGVPLAAIAASAYFPHFQQIHAFWIDPTDGQTKVVHIDSETAQARLTNVSLGVGAVNGAVAVVTEDPLGSMTKYRVYAIRLKPLDDLPPAVGGQVNINPNNNSLNEFVLTTPLVEITRDDLKKNALIDELGVLYEGPATSIHVKPKGNGNQNGLIVNGQAFEMKNGDVYDITGDLTVKLFNDHVHNFKAMGHWWIGIDAKMATVKVNGVTVFESDPDPEPTSELVSLHTQTGLATVQMQLSQVYEGLATQDGKTFYSVGVDNVLYKIDSVSASETPIGPLPPTVKLSDIEFHGSTLLGFDLISNELMAIDADTGSLIGSPASISLKLVGTMILMPTADVPLRAKLAAD